MFIFISVLLIFLAGVSSIAQTLPSPWTNRDIGSVGVAGSASYSTGTFTVKGSGSDIWGAADAFHYVYQPLVGNGQIVARVVSIQNTHASAKGGVMIRESLTADARYASMFITPGTGIRFQRRTSAGGTTTTTSGGAAAAPYWLRLVRSGNILTGYKSDDGLNWVQVGSATVTMASNVYVGLAVTSHNNSVLCTATLDNVAVGTPSNYPPRVSVTAPTNGATFTAPANITVSASAIDSDGTISKVDFYAGATLIGTDTTSPYSIVWSSVGAGSYPLTAKATDNGTTAITSSTVNVTVNASTNTPPAVGITSPTAGATFTAPANITINATASDSDGTISKVEFFQGTTKLGEDTSAPYSFAWSNVAVGDVMPSSRLRRPSQACSGSLTGTSPSRGNRRRCLCGHRSARSQAYNTLFSVFNSRLIYPSG